MRTPVLLKAERSCPAMMTGCGSGDHGVRAGPDSSIHWAEPEFLTSARRAKPCMGCAAAGHRECGWIGKPHTEVCEHRRRETRRSGVPELHRSGRGISPSCDRIGLCGGGRGIMARCLHPRTHRSRLTIAATSWSRSPAGQRRRHRVTRHCRRRWSPCGTPTVSSWSSIDFASGGNCRVDVSRKGNLLVRRPYASCWRRAARSPTGHCGSSVIRENQTIVIEDLTVRSMVRNRNLARAISDAAWAEFRSMLEYKAGWYGRDVIAVDRFFPSSNLCSACGRLAASMPLTCAPGRAAAARPMAGT